MFREADAEIFTGHGLRLPLALAIIAIAGCAAPTAPKPGSVSVPEQAAPPKFIAPASRMSATDARAMLDHHNSVRAAVGVAPLRWSPGLAAYAQDWADRLAASACKMSHRPDNAYGENLFQGTLGYYGALDAAKAWESEKKAYKDGPLTPANVKAVGHYTQMAWRGTAMVGCGEASCNKTLIVACNYDPPGNFTGRKPY